MSKGYSRSVDLKMAQQLMKEHWLKGRNASERGGSASNAILKCVSTGRGTPVDKGGLAPGKEVCYVLCGGKTPRRGRRGALHEDMKEADKGRRMADKGIKMFYAPARNN